MASSAKQSKKLHILLFPFFATSHIRPFTDLAVNLAAARPNDIKATVAVTAANASVVQSALASHSAGDHATAVGVATYAFPRVEGLPPGVENMSAVTATDAWRIEAAACDETLMRPAQEGLIRELSPDAVVTDLHFFWNAGVAAGLGMSCVAFNVVGIFPTLVMARLTPISPIRAGSGTTGAVTIPEFPAPELRVPVTELPPFLRSQHLYNTGTGRQIVSALDRCLGQAVNTFSDLEREYCDMYVKAGYVRRAYFVGPLSLPLAPPPSSSRASRTCNKSPCLDWLDTKATNSVVYLCFGSLANVSEAQLHELALGLEASMVSFLWVVRADAWAPPEGWKERVGNRGMVVRGWAPQTMVLEHPSVGAFVTQCGWNSVLETIASGVPVLTWPMVFEQFITERLVTGVLGIGERLWPEGAGVRSARREENELVPAKSVARAVAKFMEPGGAGDEARRRAEELSVKARAAVAGGGSSHRDLQCLIDDIMEARAAGGVGRGGSSVGARGAGALPTPMQSIGASPSPPYNFWP